jgi:hypothetical protein
MLRELLPNFYSGYSNKKHPLWVAEIEWDETKSVETLFILLEDELEIEFGNLDRLIQTTTNFCTDVLELKKVAFGPIEALLMFIHFEAATILIDILESRKLFNLVFDWIANSLSQQLERSIERSSEPNWLVIFITNTNRYIQKHLIDAFSLWTRCLFYYSRVEGGHKELVHFYFGHCYQYLKTLVNATYLYADLTMSFIQILAWASNNRMENIKIECVRILSYYYGLAGLPDDLKRIIAFQFSSDGYELTTISRSDWCEIVIAYGNLQGHQKLHLALNKYASSYSEIVENFEELKLAIDEYHTYLAASKIEDKYLNYELSRIFTVLQPAIIILIEASKIELANQLIALFFKIPLNEIILSTNAVVLPGTKSGACYSVENLIEYSQKDPFQFIPRITTILNSFLSRTHTLNDLFNFTAEPIKREYGIPKPELGNDLEKILVEYYCFNAEKVCLLLRDKTGYFLYNGTQLPLQALFIKYSKIALPIIHSFYNPLPVKKVRHALIWQGDTIMSERECDTLENLFQANNIKITRLNFHQSSKEEFLGYYRNEEFDLIWVSCHGEFKHFSPHESYLVLRQKFGDTSEIILGYDELKTQEIESGKCRRLLVLNACDGATTSLNNNPTSIGLGASVINQYQSLISHQWPVDNTAGLIHGVLYSIFLIKHGSYLEAYENTIKKFLEGKEAILDFFQSNSVLQETIDGIGGSSLDFTSFYYWGSLSYLE